MKTIHFLYFSIASFLFFFFLSIFIVNGNNLFFDIPIYQFLTSFSITSFMKMITFFGEAKFLIPLILISFFLFREKKYWKLFLSLMILEVGTNSMLKLFFGRARPNVTHLVNETGYSFPSGHMMAATMCYGFLIYFLWKSKISLLWKCIFSVLLGLLIIGIGFSRIYLGVHYASDILGGFLFSLFLLNFGIFFFESMEKNNVK